MERKPFPNLLAAVFAAAISSRIAIGRAIAEANKTGDDESRSRRGKGRGKHGKQYPTPTTYWPIAKRNGGQERARRVRQIARGMIWVSA